MSAEKKWTIEIEGMTCDHCARSIDEALRKIPGVVEAKTGFGERRAEVRADAAVDASLLAMAIQRRGYRAKAPVAREEAPLAPLARAAG